MFRRTLLLVTALWACGITFGAELTPVEVMAAVTIWVQQATADARPDAEIVALEPYTVAGRPVAYIATLSTGGFALCGADDRLLPVYLYSADYPYDLTDPVNQDILAGIGRRLLACEAAEAAGDPILAEYRAELSERLDLWRDLQIGRVPRASPSRSEPTTMTLPVTDFWDQRSPYNHACPVLTPGTEEHVVVGCVATAMSQIMYYWKWPTTGEGVGSTTYYYRYSDVWLAEALDHDPNIPTGWAGGDRLLYVPPQQALAMHAYWDGSLYYGGAMHLTDDPNGNPNPEYIAALESLWNRMTQDTRTCVANFGATTFDWSEIQDAHTAPYGPEDHEVAWLCYCAGVAVEMGYGVQGSSSHTSRTAEAYSNYFRYDPAAAYFEISYGSIIDEIQWLRPVQTGGQSDGGGHSFVVCGYNQGVSPPQFLINTGWGSGSTSWLTLDQFFPEDQGHVIRIAPLSVVRFVGGILGGTGAPDRPYVTLGAALADAPDDTTLIMKAGSTHTLYSNTGALNRPMILKGQGVTIGRE